MAAELAELALDPGDPVVEDPAGGRLVSEHMRMHTSAQMKDDNELTLCCGTPIYIAPEVWSRKVRTPHRTPAPTAPRRSVPRLGMAGVARRGATAPPTLCCDDHATA